MKPTDAERMKLVAEQHRVLTREGDARQRLIDFMDRLCHAEACATGYTSPLVSVGAVLREERGWLPTHLVGRREELRAYMLLVAGAVPDPFTAKRLELLIGDLATGLAFVGTFAAQADFAMRLAELVASQLLPPAAPEATP